MFSLPRTRALLLSCAAAALLAVPGRASSAQSAKTAAPTWALAIHGGAGEEEWLHMDPATQRAYHASLARALAAGVKVLQGGGKALDAVQASVEVLEDDPLFNAGRGAAFAADATNEMDAAIMNGVDLAGGGVAGVHYTKNPILLARAVMDHTPYVLMAGAGADAFSREQHLQQEPPSYFFTEMRWKEFEGVMRASHRSVPPRPAGVPPQSSKPRLRPVVFSHRFGTVGAVARDIHGHLAAATSTGGMQGKHPGRIGDSPILGAGTFADDRGCAVSGTGVGEYFIRLSLTHSISALCQAGDTPQKAADQLIHHDLPALPGGEGGVIVLARTGAPVWSNNTLGMFHAMQVQGGAPQVWTK